MRRSLNTGSMYRRTGSAYRASVNCAGVGVPASCEPGTMVFIICGGMSMDIVARSAWSRSRSA